MTIVLLYLFMNLFLKCGLTKSFQDRWAMIGSLSIEISKRVVNTYLKSIHFVKYCMFAIGVAIIIRKIIHYRLLLFNYSDVTLIVNSVSFIWH
jgi:hypothetical protein